MTSVAVVAHRKKSFGGGLPELRRVLREQGVDDALWYEVPKSRKIPAVLGEALDRGADLVFVWGGDGSVQRAVDTLAGTGATLALLPAGTANLLATNLGVPQDVSEAVAIGLHGPRRRLDVGRLNGERFAVMAGTGFDALVMEQVDGGLKSRLGRASYVWAAARSTATDPVVARVEVDGRRWFDGPMTCLLLGNVGRVFGGMELFPEAEPEDGWLEVGVVTAATPLQWARTFAHTAIGRPESSPFVMTTTAQRVDVRLEHKLGYELDGGARPRRKRLKARIEPAAIAVAVPEGCRT